MAKVRVSKPGSSSLTNEGLFDTEEIFMETVGTWWMWAGFLAIVLVMLAIDLFVVGGGKQHRVSVKEAATW